MTRINDPRGGGGSMSCTAVAVTAVLDLPVASKFCLACEYVASCAALTTTARVTVGPQPYKD